MKPNYVFSRCPIPIRELLALLIICLFPSAVSAAVVSLSFRGTVEEAFFGAAEAFPLGSQLEFMVDYETDTAINPDLNPDLDRGVYRLLRWELLDFGASPGGDTSGLEVTNGARDAILFEVGFSSLPGLTIPSRGGTAFGFNSGSLIFSDSDGAVIDSDLIPPGVSLGAWPDSGFLLRWGGADGPAIRGGLQVVPEPAVGGLMLLACLVFVRSRWR